MIPNDLKEFEKFLKICRKQGVTEVSIHNGVTVKLGDLPIERDKNEPHEDQGDSLTGDDLLYYHVNGGIL